MHVACSCGFKPSNAEWREVIAAAVEAAMSGDGVITAQEVSSECLVFMEVMQHISEHIHLHKHISMAAW